MLTYVDSSITVPTASGNQPEQFIMLITEPVLPLYLWLERRLLNDIVLDVTNMQEEEIDKSAERINTQELQLLYNEILWGFKSTLTALQFLHEQVKVCHNCIGSDGNILINPINCTSIYVNRYTSEWKLCNLEFSNSLNTPSNKEDNDFITKYYPNMNILTSCNSNSLNSAQAVVVEGNIQRDIMALGNVMTKIYNYIETTLSDFINHHDCKISLQDIFQKYGISKGGIPTSLITTLKKMTGKSASSILVSNVLNNCSVLKPANTVSIHIMEYLNELPLKIVNITDMIAFLQILINYCNIQEYPNGHIHILLSSATINYKLLNVISVLFQYCIVEYNNRNNRDQYRQVSVYYISLTVNMLLLIGNANVAVYIV